MPMKPERLAMIRHRGEQIREHLAQRGYRQPIQMMPVSMPAQMSGDSEEARKFNSTSLVFEDADGRGAMFMVDPDGRVTDALGRLLDLGAPD